MAVAVEVQPLSPVTTSEYVPATELVGFCSVELKFPGPVHAQVTVLLGDVPINSRSGMAQVTVPPEAAAPGSASSSITSAVAIAVHPFAGLETSSVYVPGTITVGSSNVDVKLFGPVQVRITPGVVEPPSSITELILQSRVPPAALALGTLASGCTLAVAVVVHPFGAVTVRV